MLEIIFYFLKFLIKYFIIFIYINYGRMFGSKYKNHIITPHMQGYTFVFHCCNCIITTYIFFK